MAEFSYAETIRSVSPNHGVRRGRGAAGPDMVVLHYTAMRDAAAALARLSDPAAEVSAHYLIDETGRVYGLVPEARRAWHAGVSAWGGDADVNSRSIGVELSHPGEPDAGPQPPFPNDQMAALEALLSAIMARWGLAPKRVVGHSDVAPGRKIDPGPAFEWARLAAAGLSIAPEARAAYRKSAPSAEWSAFDEAARRFGYGEWPRASVLDAFRRRFHSWTGAPTPLPTLPPAEAASSNQDPLRDGELALICDLARTWPA